MLASTLRKWSVVHKWTSLICTLFLLMLCITGLPLIFRHEIDAMLDGGPAKPTRSEQAAPASLDIAAGNAQRALPGQFIQAFFWDHDDPTELSFVLAPTPGAHPTQNRTLRVDAMSGEVMSEAKTRERFTYFLLRLHTDLFLGLYGKLFLGVMGLLFVVATVSGVVIYGVSMRKLSFGTMRFDRSTLLRWLDLHNLLGIVTVAWVMVVGITGVINTGADLVIKAWQNGQLVEMVGSVKNRPRPQVLASVQSAVDTAQATIPSMKPFFVAYPGSLFSSQSHYIVFMHGNAPLTARLLTPVMIDAMDGRFVDSRSLPWYVSTVLLSQPLHFGDYGGLPLKIVWAVMDIAAIAILISGLYLWIARRGRRLASREARTEAGAIRHRIDLRAVYRIPIWLMVVSLLGLVVALVGDGIWNIVGWLSLALPIFVVALKYRHARKPHPRAPGP
jgi:uncharacterized iron-regulated membrane protein